MSLAVCDVASRLYLARAAEVSVHRPLFTGDVIDDVAIPGVQPGGAAMVIAHPCSMRRGAVLSASVLVAAVRPHADVPAHKWADGYYDRMPLPEVRGAGTPFEVAWLGEIGLAQSSALVAATRIACLSPLGVNILQQRNVCNLTRVEVPTAVFWDAFAYNYEEADLLEEWTEELSSAEGTDTTAATFEDWIDLEDRRTRLRDPQQRASVRSEMRAEVKRRTLTGAP